MPIATVPTSVQLYTTTWFDAVRDSLNNVWKPAQVNFSVAGAGQTYSTAAFADVPTVTTTITPVVTGSNMWAYVTLRLGSSAAAHEVLLAIHYNGSVVAQRYFNIESAGASTYAFSANFASGTPDVSKTLKVQWWSVGGSTITLSSGHANRIIAVEY